jgi:hypothetical protein
MSRLYEGLDPNNPAHKVVIEINKRNDEKYGPYHEKCGFFKEFCRCEEKSVSDLIREYSKDVVWDETSGTISINDKDMIPLSREIWMGTPDSAVYTEEQARKIWEAGQEYWRTSGETITFEGLTEGMKKNNNI